jgi:hypothetical protein
LAPPPLGLVGWLGHLALLGYLAHLAPLGLLDPLPVAHWATWGLVGQLAPLGPPVLLVGAHCPHCPLGGCLAGPTGATGPLCLLTPLGAYRSTRPLQVGLLGGWPSPLSASGLTGPSLVAHWPAGLGGLPSTGMPWLLLPPLALLAYWGRPGSLARLLHLALLAPGLTGTWPHWHLARLAHWSGGGQVPPGPGFGMHPHVPSTVKSSWDNKLFSQKKSLRFRLHEGARSAGGPGPSAAEFPSCSRTQCCATVLSRYTREPLGA